MREGRSTMVARPYRSLLALLCLLASSALAEARTSQQMAVATTAPTASAAATTATTSSTAALSSSEALRQADQTFLRIAAGKLTGCLGQQSIDTEYHTSKKHVHRQFLRQSFLVPKVSLPKPEPGSLSYALRVGLAGGIAGATGTAMLFPVDSAKTMRQASPTVYNSVRHAFRRLMCEDGKWHVGRAYCGILPAVMGSIPSSALYFGTYETMKSIIRKRNFADPNKSSGRLIIHSLSAASGNILSSALFVPKEVIKQRMQYGGGREAGRTVLRILEEYGVQGLYSGYRATLMRNIPSAVLRFGLYEELKHRFASTHDGHQTGFSWKVFLSGAVAGGVSSGLMTPVDVIKTRIATGTCPVDIPYCVQNVVQEAGLAGLYMGAGSRMIWSAAYAAIGFGMLETAKGWLGVSDQAVLEENPATLPAVKAVKMFSRHQRSLEHAISDRYE